MNPVIASRFLVSAILLCGGFSLCGGCASSSSRPAAAIEAQSHLQHHVYDVTRFGAVGDGKALDAPAINRAIDAAHAAGGGTVHLPAGTYLCYSIRLQSNICLDLDPGATILAAPLPTPPTTRPGYDLPEPNPSDPSHDFLDFGHSHFHNSLIWGVDLENVSIRGPGLIDGAARLHGDQKGDKNTPGFANKTVALKRCRNVIIRDVSFHLAGHFAVLATHTDNLTLDNLKIDTNRDGINVDGCRNVHIANCTVNTPNDDGICLKSSSADGHPLPTENVTITNCAVSGYAAGSVLDGTFQPAPASTPNDGPMGRIKLGTESLAGFRNITISNCTFDYCHGLALLSVDGAALEDITISNITMRHIIQSPLFIRLGSRMRRRDTAPVGAIRHISLSNIVVDDDDSTVSSLICGVPGHDIEDLSLSDVRIVCRGGGTTQQAAREIEEKEKDYPEPNMFGPTPAYGFFIRHARGIHMRNVAITAAKPDARPPLVLQDVQNIRFDTLTADAGGAGTPVMNLRNVRTLDIHQSPGLRDANLKFIQQGQINSEPTP
jgi:polygalacturonase